MKIRFQMLAIMFVTVMTFSACDGDDKNDNTTAPDAVLKAFKDKYPTAMGIEWERRGSYSVTDCWMNGSEMDVWYDTQATQKLTEVDTSWEGLPVAVQTAFEDGEHAAWKLEDIDILEYPEQPIQCVVEVENGDQEYQLFYDQDDNVSDKRDVSGGKDGTHWPVSKS